MASEFVDICRSDLANLIVPPDAFITHVEHVSSYDWIEAPEPTIAVPGCPARWKAPKGAQQVQQDTGLVYIAQNAARHPDSPLEPLFRAMEVTSSDFDVTTVDIVSDRNNIRKLLSFIDPTSSRNGLEAFTINAEAIKNTAIFCRDEAKVSEIIAPNEFKGYGHEFEKSFTTRQLQDSTGHHRVLSYQFSDLKLLIRHETNGYVDDGEPSSGQDLDVLQALESLSLSTTENPPTTKIQGSIMTIRKDGKAVPIESTLEIKTRVYHKPISFTEVAAQLWISQTPRLVRAYHKRGRFEVPHVENVVAQLKSWEHVNQKVLRTLVALLRKLVHVVKCYGRAQIQYNASGDKLCIRKIDNKKMLPVDIYSKWEGSDQAYGGTSTGPSVQGTAIARADSDTEIKIGNALYQVPLSKIPYLASFVTSEQSKQPPIIEIKHDGIALFHVALAGLKFGFRECFRQLSPDIGQYQTLCRTYEFLEVDVLGGRSFHEIAIDIKSANADLDYDSRPDRRLARDTAFRLVFFILRKFESGVAEPNRLFNTVLFVISHPRTFKHRIRTVVRAAYDFRASPSAKQTLNLNKWALDRDANSDDGTTESLSDNYTDDYWSDSS